MFQLSFFVLGSLFFDIPQLFFFPFCTSVWYEEDVIVKGVPRRVVGRFGGRN
jgi:hypothetical protein